MLKIVAAAIIRDGKVYSNGHQSHALIREELGDKHPYMSQLLDTEGFLTSDGSFYDRESSKLIAYNASQLKLMPHNREKWTSVWSKRKLNSHDIIWDEKK